MPNRSARRRGHQRVFRPVGEAVILASRIAGLGSGGQILISSMLHDLAENAGDLRSNPLREKQLKGFGGAHSVYELVWRD